MHLLSLAFLGPAEALTGHLGASTASGDWFLFTDADCWLKKEVIARAIAVAEWENVDHVTLTPVSRFRRFLPKRGISLS